MRLTRKAVLAGLASFAVAGAALAAEAPQVHSLRIALPDGGSATIHYAGDVAPRVVVDRAPLAPLAFDAAPFAAMARLMAEMDRRAAALMMSLAPDRSGDPGLERVSLPGFAPLAAGALPPGAVSYSYVSETTGNGRCVRSVAISRSAADAKPRVVSQVSGDCAGTHGDGPARSAPAAAAKPAKPEGPPLRETI